MVVLKIRCPAGNRNQKFRIKLTAAAVCLYRADCGGKIFKIQLVIKNRTTEIIQTAEILPDECDISENADQSIGDC